MFIVWIVLGIISVLYGGFIRAANSGTKFYLVWIAIGFVCAVLAVVTRKKLWIRIPKTIRILGGILIGLGAAVFLVVEGFIVSRFHERPEEDLDCLIVLGAQLRESGPSVVLRYRLDAAYSYLAEHENTICIVSGGQGYNEPTSEAEGMRRYLVERGIAAERILLEDQSADTHENLINSMRMLDPEHDRVGIVTNNFHLFRAVMLAQKAGIRHVRGIAAGSTKAYLPNNMLREFLGVMKDLAVGNLV